MNEPIVGGIKVAWELLVGVIKWYVQGKEKLTPNHVEPLHEKLYSKSTRTTSRGLRRLRVISKAKGPPMLDVVPLVRFYNPRESSERIPATAAVRRGEDFPSLETAQRVLVGELQFRKGKGQA